MSEQRHWNISICWPFLGLPLTLLTPLTAVLLEVILPVYTMTLASGILSKYGTTHPWRISSTEWEMMDWREADCPESLYILLFPRHHDPRTLLLLCSSAMLNTHTILRLLQRIRRLAFILSTTIARKLTPFHWWRSLLVTLRALRGICRTDSNPKPPSMSCADSTLGLDLHASSSSSRTARLQNVIGSNPEAPRDEVISFSSISGVTEQISAFSGEPGEDVTASALEKPYSMMAEITDLVAITTREEYERYTSNKP